MKRHTETSGQAVFNQEHKIFSNNYKISPRQIRRAVILELFGASSLLLPGYLAQNSGIGGVAALLIGGAGAFILLFLWNRMAKSCVFSVEEELKSREASGRGLWARRIVQAAAGVGLVLIASYVLYLLAILVREQLLGVQYEPVILITLTLAGVLGLWKGLEMRVRIYEVVFWFLLAPLAVILILACVSVTPDYWVISQMTAIGFFRSCYASFMFFAVASLFLFFRPHCRQPEKAVRSVRSGLVTAIGLNVAVYLILLGVFQQKLLAQLDFPVIFLMAVVKLPGEFFERQDALMTGIWFFCLFALFASLLFYGKELLRGGFSGRGSKWKKKEQEKNGPSPEFWWSTGCGGAAFLGAFSLLRLEGLAELVIRVIFGGIGPMLLLLPFLYYLCAKKRSGGV